MLVTPDRPACTDKIILGQVAEDSSPHAVLLGELVLVAHDEHPMFGTGECDIDPVFGLYWSSC